jgi:hypothetical protein
VLHLQLFRLFSPTSAAVNLPPKMWASHPHTSVFAEAPVIPAESPYIISCIPKAIARATHQNTQSTNDRLMSENDRSKEDVPIV